MDLRYPIGKYEPQPFSDKQKREWLQDIQFLPGLLEMAIENLDEKQLNTPYRDGGWSVKASGTSRGRQPYERLHPV